jgi:anthranilate synthase component 1
MVVRSCNGVTTVQDANGVREESGTAVDVLRREFAHRKLAAAEGLAPMAGGCVGYLGYAASRWFDPAMQAHTGSGDDACFLIFRTVLAFDHARQQIQIRTLAEVEPGASEAVLRAKFEEATAQNREVVRKLSAAVELPLKAMAVAGAGEADFESNFERGEFEDAVAEGKELIYAGECFQIVLSQRFRRKTKANAVALYRALRATNPSPYMFHLNFGPSPETGDEQALIGASPEMLVRCRANELTYRPIAGTRTRGANAEQDAQLAGELLADEKERAEHMMLVDLGRNDLGRVASYGTVKVNKLMIVEKYSHVQHLVTELKAELRPGLDRFDALGACFPAGTVTGAPKIRAMQGIAELERGARLAYSGAVLYAD